MFSWDFHKWLVESDGSVLRFYRNDLPQVFGGLFHQDYDAAFGAWMNARHELMNSTVHCDAVDLRCEFPKESATEMLLRDSATGPAKINFADATNRPRYSAREIAAIISQSFLPRGLFKWLQRERTKSGEPAVLPASTISKLMCLECRSASLTLAGESIHCHCGHQYSKHRGVFDFDAEKQVVEASTTQS